MSITKLLKRTLISLTALVVLAAVFFIGQEYLHGRIMPKTSVGPISIGLMEMGEALVKLEKETGEFLEKEIEIQIDEEVKMIPLKDPGVTIQTEGSIAMIEKSDHRFMTNYLDLVQAEPFKGELLTSFDTNTLLEAVYVEFGLTDQLAKNAEFFLDESGNLQVREETEGLKISEAELIAGIKESVQKLQPQKITLTTESAEAEITAEILETQRESMEEKLSRTITLHDPIYSDPWKVRLRDYPEWVSIEKTSNFDILADGYYTIKINQDGLDAFLDEEVSKWLDQEVDEVKIYMDENEEVVIEGVGIEGTAIERKNLNTAIDLALDLNFDEIVIPIRKVEPVLNISPELQELGIKEIVGVGHTSFYGSPSNRIHNIKVGSSVFDGDLIAPDELYSFNTNLGRVDASTGYRKELVIKPEGTIPEYGGGICQVSTTLYRALIFSDIEITDRRPHSYAVSYYSQVMGDGLDATIYLGGQDLQFVNDTGQHLLMQFYVKDDYELYVIFYGTKKDFEIEMEGPYLSGYHNPGPTQYIETTDLAPGETKQVEKSHTGFTATWYKHITYPDGTTETEEIISKYKAVPAKIMVGAGTPEGEI